MTTKFEDLVTFRISTPLEVKFAADQVADGLVTGYASTFGGDPDSHGDVIAPGAFAKSLSAHHAAGTAPAMLWSHDPAAPIGRWIELQEDSVGLLARGQLNLQTDRGRQAYAHLKAGDIGGLSIGYRVLREGRTSNNNGTTTLTALELLEISVVAVPANRRARVSAVKHLASQHELERLLHDTGLSRGAAVKLAAGGWPALTGQEPENPEIQHLGDRIGAAFAALKSLKG